MEATVLDSYLCSFQQHCSVLAQHLPFKDSPLLLQLELQYFPAGQGMPIVQEEKGEELLN